MIYRHLMTRTKTRRSSLIDVSSAQVTVEGRTVVVDDPGSPLLASVEIGRDWRIRQLSLTIRHPSGRITGTSLARLPIAQIERVARSLLSTAPQEAWWTGTVVVRPMGQRSWPDEHWDRVLAVYDWAESTNRPGGGVAVVAELWGVAKNPTAYRWLARARRTVEDRKSTAGRTT